MDLCGGSYQVRITQFINPHLFWYKRTAHDDDRRLVELELDLQAAMSLPWPSHSHTPVLHETVAVKHLACQNKWIRARVDELLEEADTPKYVLWTLDHGFTLIAHPQQIRPLSEELAARPLDCVHQAGIVDVIPIESHFNYARMCNEMHTARNWPDCAVRHVETMFNDASEIYFETILVLNDDATANTEHRSPPHAFGHIEVETHSGQRVNAADMLIAMGSAKRQTGVEFRVAIEASTSTRNLRRWLDNRNNPLERPNAWYNVGAGERRAANECVSVAGGLPETDDMPLLKSSGMFVGNDGPNVPRPPNQRSMDPLPDRQQETLELDFPAPMPPVPIDGAVTLRDDHPMLLRIRQRQRAMQMMKPQPSTTSAVDVSIAAPSMPTLVPVKQLSSAVAKPASLFVPAGFALDQLHTVNRRPDDRYRHEMRARSLRAKQESRAHQAIVELDSLEAISPSKSSQATVVAATSSAVEPLNPPPPSAIVDSMMPILSRIPAVNPNVKTKQMTSFADGSSTSSIVKRGGGSGSFGASNIDHCIKNSLNLHRVLVHGVSRPQPLDSIKAANFTDCVHETIRRMRFTEIYRTQAYVWPHLLQGNSAMLINAAGSGKTIAYLPAVCSLVQELYNDGRVQRGCAGPVAIIMCVSARSVAHVAQLARQFMGHERGNAATEWPVVEAFGRREMKRMQEELLSGCALLVCTAPCLRRLFSDSGHPLIDGRRLRILVLDDVDLLAERSLGDFTAAYSKLMRLTRRQHGDHSSRPSSGACRLQLVVTARRWRNDLRYFFTAANDLALVMGAYAEAAVYAKTGMQLQLLQADAKLDELVAAVRAYRTQATLVVCNDAAEARAVAARLRHEMIDCVLYDERCNTDGDLQLAIRWNRAAAAAAAAAASPSSSASLAVLVCTDQTIAELRISYARNIVHYSIPATWTQFAYRWSSSFEYFDDFVRHADAVRPAPHSLVLLDEHNTVQLPRLVDFLEQHGVKKTPATVGCSTNEDDNDDVDTDRTATTIVPQVVRQLADRIRHDAKPERNGTRVPFCGNVLLVGDCHSATCGRRHVLTAADATDAASLANLPTLPGVVVRLVVQQIVTATEFWVRVLKYRLPRTSEWLTSESAAAFLHFSIEFANWYGRDANRRRAVGTASAATVGELYVIEEDGAFHRCRVTAIRKSLLSSSVELHLIDTGLCLSACRPSELLELDARFRSQPAQSICVRIADCVPCDGDTEWESNARQFVQKLLHRQYTDGESNSHNVHLEGRIQFSVLDTIWLDSLSVVEWLPTLRQDVHHMSVRRELIREQFGVMDRRPTEILLRMANRAGIVVHAEPPAETDTQRDPCDGGLTFSVSTASNATDDQRNIAVGLPQPENDCKNSDEPFRIDQTLAAADGHQLPPPSQLRGRRVPLSRQTGLLDVVSHADGQRYHPERSRLTVDGYESVFVSSFFTPDLCYLQKRSIVLDQLYDAIDHHMATLGQSGESASIENAMVGSYCLAAYDGNFNRARIERIIEPAPIAAGEQPANGDAIKTVELFFVDLGHRMTDVRLDALLPLTDKLLRITPFQAIRCRLAALRPMFGDPSWSLEHCDRIYEDVISPNDSEHRLYVRTLPTIERRHVPSDVGEHELVHDVVMFQVEAHASDNLEMVNVNLRIVEMELAAFDPEQEHVLDMQMSPQDAVRMADNQNKQPVNDIEEDPENWDTLTGTYPERFEGPSSLMANRENNQPDDSAGEYELDIQFTSEELDELRAMITGQLMPAVDDKTQEIVPFVRTTNDKSETVNDVDENDHDVVDDDDDGVTPSTENEIINEGDGPMPRLCHRWSYKQPLVRWTQNDSMIHLAIEAPDVTEYELHVTPERILSIRALLPFAGAATGAAVGSDLPTTMYCLLHLFGALAVEYTSHELRGLWLHVRLIKLLRGPAYNWLRLTKQSVRLSWLRYDLDAIEVTTNECRRRPAQRVQYRAHSEDSSSNNNSSCDEEDPSKRDGSAMPFEDNVSDEE